MRRTPARTFSRSRRFRRGLRVERECAVLESQLFSTDLATRPIRNCPRRSSASFPPASVRSGRVVLCARSRRCTASLIGSPGAVGQAVRVMTAVAANGTVVRRRAGARARGGESAGDARDAGRAVRRSALRAIGDRDARRRRQGAIAGSIVDGDLELRAAPFDDLRRVERRSWRRRGAGTGHGRRTESRHASACRVAPWRRRSTVDDQHEVDAPQIPRRFARTVTACGPSERPRRRSIERAQSAAPSDGGVGIGQARSGRDRS